MSKGVFVIFPVGKSLDPSKSGKRLYTFLEGRQIKTNNNMFDNCKIVESWTVEDFKFEFLKPVNAILDRQTMSGRDGGSDKEFIKLVQILPDTTTMAELQGIMEKLSVEDREEKIKKRKEEELKALQETTKAK